MKVLIAGFGSVAKKHYHALLQSEPSVGFVALRSNTSKEPIQNVLSIYNTSELRLNAPYDFAIISNPTNKHEETIELLLELRCPLFIEKPLFHTLNSERILNKIAGYGIITYVACNLRFLDSLIFLKEKLLPNIKVNEVNVYCGSFLPEWRQGVDYKTVYSAHSDQGGGVHLDLIHELDYSFWLFGKPLNVTSHRRSKSTIDIDAIDYANYFLEYDRFAVNIILNYYRKDKKRSIELVCSEDTYLVDLCTNSVSSTKELLFRSKQDVTDTYKKQMEYFIEIINSPSGKNGEIMNNVEEAFEVLKICLTNDIK
jgi:predicted dehydrogenase